MLCTAFVLALLAGSLPVSEVWDCSVDPVRFVRSPSSGSTYDGEASLWINVRAGGPVDSGLSESQPRLATIEGFGPVQGLSEWMSWQSDLEELSLICVYLSDADVRAASRIPRLERLDLRGCVVSETQLDVLCAVKTLREVDLRGASVSDESQRKLRTRFPRLVIRVGDE